MTLSTGKSSYNLDLGADLDSKILKVQNVSFSPHLDDEERLRVLVMMSAQELANGISYSGHMYAVTRAGRHLTPAGDLQETFGGMEQVWHRRHCCYG